ESKQQLEESKKVQAKLKPTKEQKLRMDRDYKLFTKDDTTKDLVYYSEKSGFYKYFEDQINVILEKSDFTIHYVTSDPNDKIFDMENERIIPYYVDDTKLIYLFMKLDARVMIMTTPNLQTYHLKRSLARKDIEYIYTPHDPLSTHMGAALGAFDHFDTILCVGQHQVEELRETEKVYELPEKNLVPCGYSLIDNLIAHYEAMEKTENPVKKILIAPSWQEDNILESCIEKILDGLLDKGYDITLRPHPEFVKRSAARMQTIINQYESKFNEHFRIETDFSSNVTIFTADLVVTDWSGIAFEFAYATKKPCLFINTPMKVMNPEYGKIGLTPVEVALRGQLGQELEPDELSNIASAVDDLFKRGDVYEAQIRKLMDKYLFHPGESAQVAGKYIIDAVNRHQGKF
ncbi:CDP-glycerol glycerophosphotransferase family protein, partial [Clostridia bacterium OttesenSCG-928-F22]|nr:CDP-glycerol glycerophosphotransferase family protein [Clostridia bacterium OttesenSCG-928-F22]